MDNNSKKIYIVQEVNNCCGILDTTDIFATLNKDKAYSYCNKANSLVKKALDFYNKVWNKKKTNMDIDIVFDRIEMLEHIGEYEVKEMLYKE